MVRVLTVFFTFEKNKTREDGGQTKSGNRRYITGIRSLCVSLERHRYKRKNNLKL